MWSILYYLRNRPEVIKRSLEKRNLSTESLHDALKYDKLWREKLRELELKRHQHNLITRKIGVAKNLEERASLIRQAKKLVEEIKELDKAVKSLKNKHKETLLSIPNLVHETTPVGKDESDNVPVLYYGKPKVWKEFLDQFKNEIKGFEINYEIIDKKPLTHYEMSFKLGHIDSERGAKVAGARFYYLYEDLVWLDFALIMYAMEFLNKKGYILVEPPFMMKRKAYEGVTSLSDFEESLYKIEKEDLYLIATAEHPIAAMFMNEVLERDELPLRFVGVSPCFRKEAGAHGKDTKGIFRVHQFNKVEQFVFSLPEDSWKIHEELLNNAIEIWKGLGIPFRVVNVCTGDLGSVAAKKYDIEAWMPGQGKFREVVSCSNCTDYQSYRLNIRYAKKRGLPSEGYVHTLNSTAIATSRAITAILENFQEEDGSIIIPKVLRKYLENIDKAPKEKILPLNMRWR